MATPADVSEIQKTPQETNVALDHEKDVTDTSGPGRQTMWRSIERTLLRYNIETRGIQRVEDHEKQKQTWFAYVQVFVLWTSINLVINNITLGMLGPAVYELSFTDSCLCAAFGAVLGSLPVAWIATWGPESGIRTMAWGRYAMGWWPSKLVVVLNIVVMLGYALLVCIIGGQTLSAVSPEGSMSVTVGVVVVALITWGVTTFGISVFHYYERFAWIPQLIVFCILYGVAAKNFDLITPSQGDSRTVTGNRISFFSLCVSAAITYAGLGMDFFVYWPSHTNKKLIFSMTLLGLVLSFTFAFVLGIGIASGININQDYSDAWTDSQGGSGSGALLVESFAPLGHFGKFCAVIIALGGIANTIPPTYASGIDFQILGRYFALVPRVVWNTIGVIIYMVCALAGQNHLAEIFTNFLALMGYWVAIWVAILLEEFFIFRKGKISNYDWTAWDDAKRLPVGLAALAAFLIGWVGAVLCMAQVWFIGPIAATIGDYGADLGNYVGFCWAAIAFPPLRYLELKRFKR